MPAHVPGDLPIERCMMNQSQYAIWYDGMIIEHTGYFHTQTEAYKWACSRYGAEGIQIQPVYPNAGEKYPAIKENANV